MEIIAKPENCNFIFIRVNLCDEDLSYGMDETTCVLSWKNIYLKKIIIRITIILIIFIIFKIQIN